MRTGSALRIRAHLPIALCFVIGLLAACPTAEAATSPTLRAGAGQADITPPLGYTFGGWQRADQSALGVSTRLFSRALVLQRGPKKVALVSASLVMVTAGMERDIAAEVRDLGLTSESILLTANHTHSGPGGYMNNPAFNADAPSTHTIDDPRSFSKFFLEKVPADKTLYTFLVKQIAQSIRRANADRAPAAAGWGQAELLGVTTNRSLEAFLMNFGIDVPYGQGTVDMAPGGYRSTIDPDLDLLRVDKLVKRRVACAKKRGRCVRLLRRPIGAWTTFANHGTVVHGHTGLYSEDHFAAANRVFEQQVRAAVKVPAKQTVTSVFANGAEGDISSAFDANGKLKQGIGPAEDVGRKEGQKMFEAWRQAGKRLSRRPEIDVRSTVACLCARQTATGPLSADPVQGLPFLTGSEEGRGPLYDVTQKELEGVRSPSSSPEQGNKVAVPIDGAFPPAVPFTLVRFGDRAIGALPLEVNKMVGETAERQILTELQGSGVRRAVIAGLADDWVGYATTPQEYAWQSYEAGRTGWGPNTGTFMQERLVDLAKAMASGTAAPESTTYDASYGIAPVDARFPEGTADGKLTGQPAQAVDRGTPVTVSWSGAPKGYDRPLDTAFVRIERQTVGRWREVGSDLGLDVVWRADDAGAHSATWWPPSGTATGTYRLVITAQRYRLESKAFSVR